MKVKMLKTSVADGRFVRGGAIEEVSDAEAKSLILLGKAVAVEAEEAPAPVVEEELTTETAEAVVETKLKRGKSKSLKG